MFLVKSLCQEERKTIEHDLSDCVKLKISNFVRKKVLSEEWIKRIMYSKVKLQKCQKFKRKTKC